MSNQTFRTSRLLLPVMATGVLALVTPAFGQVINEDVKIFASDGAANDNFGESIAIADGVVAVGSNQDDDNGSLSGSAYLFDATTGVQTAKLLPNDGMAFDRFGISIAMDNGVVAVGTYQDDDNGFNSGSAYLFDASTGVQIAKLLPSDGDVNDEFGIAIAIADGVVAVGAWKDNDNGGKSGSAYLFNAITGAQIVKLLPSDGAVEDEFGNAIAIADGVVAVGAHVKRGNGRFSGSAYLFDATTGIQLAKLLPSDGAASDNFGISIAIDNGVVAVGAWADDDNGSNSGSAYLFDATTAVQIAKLQPSDGDVNEFFGGSIAIGNGVVAVGAFRDGDNGFRSGSAYIFDATTGIQIAKLLPNDGAADDQFGNSIAIDTGVVAVGANLDGDNGFESGSAYVFIVPGADCPADLTGDGKLDFLDISAFLAGFTGEDSISDLNGDGLFDFLDISDFLTSFTAGCP